MKNRKILKNNATLIYDANPDLHAVKISLFFKAGTYYETPKTYGISHLTEHLFFRRTGHLTQKELYRQTEIIGAYLRGRTFRDFVCFDLTVVPENVKSAVEILAMILQPFEWTEQEVSAEKQVVLRQIYNKNETFNEYQERLYFDCGKYSVPIMGDAKTVNEISCHAVNLWKQKYFVCDNACIVLTGAFSDSDLRYVIDTVEKVNNQGAKISDKTVRPKEIFSRKNDRIISSNDTVSDFWITFDVDHTIGFTEAEMISDMLCRGDGSRLSYLLKDQLALTDYVDAALSLYHGFGAITLTFSVDNRVLEQALDLIFREIVDFKTQITETEFASTLPFYTTNLIMATDDLETLNFDYGWRDFILDEDFSVSRFPAITVQTVTAAANQILTAENMSIFVCNNSKILPKRRLRQILSDIRCRL